jgi:diacylglycerol kinase (ATP)
LKRITFIVNPHSSNGSTLRQWPIIRSKARDRLGSFNSLITAGPGDATRLVRQAALSGAEVLIGVGGDGTLNEMVNGIMSETGPLRASILLGFIPRGTGCDLAKTLPISRDLDRALDSICNFRNRQIDVGRLTFRDHRGLASCRYFHNVVSFGLGGEVDARVNRTTKVFGGFISFIWATLICILCFKKKRIRLRVDDHFDEMVTVWNIAIANGQFHGGGMWVAPGASVSDGLFQLTVVGDLNKADVFWSLPKLYNGKIYEHKKVWRLVGMRIMASSFQTVLLDMDGEQPGRLPVDIEIVPSAIRIICDEVTG